MKRLLMFAMLVSIGLFSALTDHRTWGAEEGPGLPPVAQTVIREGDFAISLAEVLGIGSAESEAEAESGLAAVGISPPNGWIADYPVTPDTVEALYKAVGEAADAKRLPMGKDEALNKYAELTASLGLPIRPDEAGSYAGEAPAADYGSYSDPSVISNYYYNQGPPVVTYYRPPWDYYHIYHWVSHPFWWGPTFFSGFFILNDFHTFRKVVVVKKHGHKFVTHKRVTNHFFDKKRHKFGRVDPLHRLRGDKLGGFHHKSDGRGFRDHAARRGAESIFKRHTDRARSFGDRGIDRRKDFSSGFRHDGFRGQAPTHRFDSGVRKDRNTGAFGSNDRARQFRGSGAHRGMGQRFENRSSRFEKGGAGGFGSPRNERGGRDFRNPSFSSGGSRGGERKFSRGGSNDGRSFSRGGGSGGRGFSGSRGSGRGGGGGCRGRC
jgi:hypothetical protein